MRKISKEELQEILEKHKLWMVIEDGGEHANLRSANLSSANLRGAGLEYANLSSANLRGAKLIGAKLIGANLRGANLRGAKLIGANLQYAEVSATIINSLIGAFPYNIYWTSNILQIGCVNKTHDEWKSMSDEEIHKICEKENISMEELQEIKDFVYRYVFKEGVRNEYIY
jgi:hypothetical protein